MFGLAVGAVGGCSGYGVGILAFRLGLLAVLGTTGAKLDDPFYGENLIYTETGAIHLFSDFGTELAFAFEEGEQLVGVVPVFISEEFDLLAHFVEFGLKAVYLLSTVFHDSVEPFLLNSGKVVDHFLYLRRLLVLTGVVRFML